MKALRVVLAAVLCTSHMAIAACYSQRDYKSGNYYTVCPDQQGTDLRGFNAQNGTRWNERMNRDGSYHGQDGQGNFYQGNQPWYGRHVHRERRGKDMHGRPITPIVVAKPEDLP